MNTATMSARATTQRRRPRYRTALVAAHVIVSVSWLGADLVLVLLGIRTLTSGDVRTGQSASGSAAAIATWLIAPLSVLALLTGLVLCVTSRRALFRQLWVLVSLGLTVVLALAANLVLGPVLTGLAHRLAAAPPTARVVDVLGPAAAQLVLPPVLAAVILGFVASTMVARPWGRIGDQDRRAG